MSAAAARSAGAEVDAAPVEGIPRPLGHDAVRGWLRSGGARSMAFVGPDAVGRRTTARWYAAWANCSAPGEDPCGTCPSCRAADAGAHPDLLEKAPSTRTASGRAARRRSVTIDRLVPRETPKADPEPVSRWLERRPRFRVRVAVITDAHLATESAANAFLKTLEEPPSWARIVLIAPSPTALAPTLASRCVTVRFGAAPTDGFEDLAPHPALRSGQIGHLIRARRDPEVERAVREAATSFVAALDGPLDEALAAGRAWIETWSAHPERAPAERTLEHLRRDAPHRYAAALEAVPEADEALRAYVTPSVVANALTLRLRDAGHG